MTSTEYGVRHNLEAAEQALDDASLALEAAREHVVVVTRRESRQERVKARARVIFSAAEPVSLTRCALDGLGLASIRPQVLVREPV